MINSKEWKKAKVRVSSIINGATALGYTVDNNWLREHQDKFVSVHEPVLISCENGHSRVRRAYTVAAGPRHLSTCTQCFWQKKLDSKFGPGHITILEFNGSHKLCLLYCNETEETFQKRPSDLYEGKSSCICSTRRSRGESIIIETLRELSLSYEEQYSFEDCKDKNPLRYDFKVECQGTFFLLEFDGRQHFESSTWFGGLDSFNDRQRRDKIKDDYCETHGIFLIRIQNKKINFVLHDKERVVAALIKAGAIMAFFSNLNKKHPWVISIEI